MPVVPVSSPCGDDKWCGALLRVQGLLWTLCPLDATSSVPHYVLLMGSRSLSEGSAFYHLTSSPEPGATQLQPSVKLHS